MASPSRSSKTLVPARSGEKCDPQTTGGQLWVSPGTRQGQAHFASWASPTLERNPSDQVGESLSRRSAYAW